MSELPLDDTPQDIPSPQGSKVKITDTEFDKLSAKKILSNYVHDPKKEHPCYITTAVRFEYY